jgi:hypothetical protein
VLFAESTRRLADERTFVTAVHQALAVVAERLEIREALAKHSWAPSVRSLVVFLRALDRQVVVLIDEIEGFIGAVLEARGGRGAGADAEAFLTQLLGSPEILVVATSRRKGPAGANPSEKLKAPWERFAQRPLPGLRSLSEANLLLQKRAESLHGGESGLTDPRRFAGRVRALYELSAGNPRTLLHLLLRSRPGAAESLQGALSWILDELGPALDAEIDRQVPASKQPVLHALCQLGGRGTAREVARATVLLGTGPEPDEVRGVGKILSELARTDFVQKAPERHVYETTPPLFQLCYELRYLGTSQRTILLEVFESASASQAGAGAGAASQQLQARTPFRRLLGSALTHALAGRRVDALRDAEEGMDLVDDPEPRTVALEVYDRLLLPLLAQDKPEEAMRITRSLCDRTDLEVRVFLEAFQTVIEHVRSPGDGSFSSLAPVEQVFTREVLRQARAGRSVVAAARLAKAGRPAESLALLEEASAERPDDVTLLRQALTIALDAGMTSEAQSYAQRGIEASAGAALDQGNLGLLLLANGETTAGRQALKQAVDEETPAVAHYRALAGLHARSRRLDEAAAVLRAALQLDLDADAEAEVRLDLTGHLILLDGTEGARSTLDKVAGAEDLPEPRVPVIHFLQYLIAALDGDAAGAETALAAYCQHLLEQGALVAKDLDLSPLIRHAEDHLSERQSVVLRRWSEVTSGQGNAGEFVQLHGTARQRQLRVERWEDEGALALERLLSGALRSLADIESASTRDGAVAAAVDALSSSYRELSAAKQRTVQSLVLEALHATRASDVHAAIRAVAHLFWDLPPDARRDALQGLLELGDRPDRPAGLREDALRVIGALSGHLETDELDLVSRRLSSIPAAGAPTYLEELLERLNFEPGEEQT